MPTAPMLSSCLVQSIYLAQSSEGREDSEKQPNLTKGNNSETLGGRDRGIRVYSVTGLEEMHMVRC